MIASTLRAEATSNAPSGFWSSRGCAIRLANYAGKPLDGALSAIPKLNGAVHNALRGAIMQCLTVAIEVAGGRDVRAVRPGCPRR